MKRSLGRLLDLALLVPVAACAPSGGVDTGDGASAGEMIAVDPCSACDIGQVCVQSLDGACRIVNTRCVTTNLQCQPSPGPPGSCSAACQQVLCGDPKGFVCFGLACGRESPRSYRCYGSWSAA